ncbi:Phloem protein 2-like [Dillenia turbinata]|uniref:Phloem protein 2-like n=1 Tax=Dillenia turbinata TaxID=194707 RepID=A0AAN8UEH2_9MAGN
MDEMFVGNGFPEVAELLSVCWLEIRGRIKTSMLSSNTIYAAYLVYKFAAMPYGLDHHPAELSIGTSAGKTQTRTVILGPERGHRQPRPFGGQANYWMRLEASAAGEGERQESYGKERPDGWMEVELGEFYSETGEDGELEMSVMEVKGGNRKGGLIVQGIEIRPQKGRPEPRAIRKMRESFMSFGLELSNSTSERQRSVCVR